MILLKMNNFVYLRNEFPFPKDAGIKGTLAVTSKKFPSPSFFRDPLLDSRKPTEK